MLSLTQRSRGSVMSRRKSSLSSTGMTMSSTQSRRQLFSLSDISDMSDECKCAVEFTFQCRSLREVNIPDEVTMDCPSWSSG